MVGIPSLADMIGPIVDPQAESFLTTISYKIQSNTIPFSSCFYDWKTYIDINYSYQKLDNKSLNQY